MRGGPQYIEAAVGLGFRQSGHGSRGRTVDAGRRIETTGLGQSEGGRRIQADGFRAVGRGRRIQADGFRADGLRADGLRADGLRADGFRADGLRADGLTLKRTTPLQESQTTQFTEFLPLRFIKIYFVIFFMRGIECFLSVLKFSDFFNKFLSQILQKIIFITQKL